MKSDLPVSVDDAIAAGLRSSAKAYLAAASVIVIIPVTAVSRCPFNRRRLFLMEDRQRPTSWTTNPNPFMSREEIALNVFSAVI
jgi:hypothetical protein